jgi:hypothetical protein
MAAISSATAGATAGLQIGAYFGNPVAGAAIGGAAGFISGGISDLAGYTAASQEEDYYQSEIDTLGQSMEDLVGIGSMQRGIQLEKFEEQKEQLAFGGQMSMQDILDSYDELNKQTVGFSGAAADQRKNALKKVRAEQRFGTQNLITGLGENLMGIDEYIGGQEGDLRVAIADATRRRNKAHSESTMNPFD